LALFINIIENIQAKFMHIISLAWAGNHLAF